MKDMFRPFVLGAALLLFATGASAAGNYASLRVVNGPVLVSHGSGFGTVVGTVNLKIGDRIMAGHDALAFLRYDDCNTEIKPDSVVTVAKGAPCITYLQSETYVENSGFIGAIVPPVVVPAQMAGGFLGVVGVNEVLTSAPAAN